MKILVRSFNPQVQGKTGLPLHPKNYRDSSGWVDFESIILNSLNFDLIHLVPDSPLQILPLIKYYDIRIKQHGTKAEYPCFDFFYMQMFHKYIFEFDHHGWGVLNSKKLDYKKDINYVNRDSLKKVNYIRHDLLCLNSKHKQKSLKFLNNHLPADFIFVPLQTPTDFVIKNFSPINVFDFIKHVGNLARYLKINFVFTSSY